MNDATTPNVSAYMPEWLWARYESLYAAAYWCQDAELSALYTARSFAIHDEWFVTA